MTTRKNVRGSQKAVLERELNKDTVYLRSNIHQIEDKHGHKLWEYDVIEMSYEEYFKLTVPQTEDTLTAAVVELSLLLAEIDAKVAALEGGK